MKNLTSHYAWVQTLYWAVFATTAGYISVYLLALGLSSSVIGLILAVAGISSTLLQPIFAKYADRPKSMTVRQLLLIFNAAMFLIAVLLMLGQQGYAIKNGILFGLCILLLQLEMPFVNALSTQSIQMGHTMNFGFGRAAGSVGYAAVSTVLGYGIREIAPWILPPTLIVLCALFAVVIYRFPLEKGAAEEQETVQKKAFLRRYPRFSMVLLGCVLIYFSHIVLNNFAIQIVQSKGGDSADMGIMISLAAIAELPPLFFYDKLLKKFRCDFLLRFGGVFFPVKAFACLLVGSVLGLYWVQFFQMLAWGVFAGSAVYFAKEAVAKEDSVQGQAYMTMTYTLASVLGSLLGGAWIDALGVPMTLVLSTLVSTIGAGLVIIYSKNRQK